MSDSDIELSPRRRARYPVYHVELWRVTNRTSSSSSSDRALQKLHEGMEEEANLFLIYCSMPPGGMEEEEMVATVNADIQITNLL